MRLFSAQRPKVLVLAGPTAIGKSSLALRVAHRLNGEIIAADACQIYKNCTIGTCQMPPSQQMGIPHHLQALYSPNTPISVADWVLHAKRAMSGCVERGKVPILVGGCGYYLRNLLYNHSLETLGASDHAFCQQIEDKLRQRGYSQWQDVVEHAVEIIAASGGDTSDAAKKRLLGVERGNIRRLVRQVELCVHKRQVPRNDIPQCPEEWNSVCEMDYRCLFLIRDRCEMYRNIDYRCERLLEEGLFDEVLSLEKRNELGPDSALNKVIGYDMARKFLKSHGTDVSQWRQYKVKALLEDFSSCTRGYAKRQISWFKKEPMYEFVHYTEEKQWRVEEYCEELLALSNEEHARRCTAEAYIENQLEQRKPTTYGASESDMKRYAPTWRLFSAKESL